MNDEFYIGWQERTPRQTAKSVRLAIVGLLCVLVAGAAVIGSSQRLIGRSVFEWGKIKEFSGVLKANPVPHLVVPHDGTNRFYYLVRPWKYGFNPELAAKFDGQQITL